MAGKEKAKATEEALAKREQALDERETALNGRETALAEQETALEERAASMDEREAGLAEKEAALNERESSMTELVDTEEIEWNNLFAAGIGVKLKKLVGRNLLLQYGIEATRERYWVSDETLDVVFVYLNWSSWWDPRAVRRDLPE